MTKFNSMIEAFACSPGNLSYPQFRLSVHKLYISSPLIPAAYSSWRTEIETAIHHPIPPRLQPAYASHNVPRGSLPVTERLQEQVLSLPMGSALGEAQWHGSRML
jgi:dTDP-4-amino-4,6-dideoxygalactose transaminase